MYNQGYVYQNYQNHEMENYSNSYIMATTCKQGCLDKNYQIVNLIITTILGSDLGKSIILAHTPQQYLDL